MGRRMSGSRSCCSRLMRGILASLRRWRLCSRRRCVVGTRSLYCGKWLAEVQQFFCLGLWRARLCGVGTKFISVAWCLFVWRRIQPILQENYPFLRQKICLMALIESVFKRNAYDRTMSFQTIAEETRLPLDEVEHLIMKALRCVSRFRFAVSIPVCVCFGSVVLSGDGCGMWPMYGPYRDFGPLCAFVHTRICAYSPAVIVP